jgi:carbamoyl-phosphate synthase small subunit
MNANSDNLPCKLALEDGCVFTGRAVGAAGTSAGEVVFNTAMTGYQEVLTDPSYCGQIVVMTFPLLGNYGVNPQDFESPRTALSGVVLKELPRRPSNYRATLSLPEFLRQQGVIGLANVDTRALTRRIRTHGALRGVISTEELDDLKLVRMARAADSMNGANLVERVAPRAVRSWTTEADPRAPHVVAVDCGIKHNILRLLADAGCRVTVAPAGAGAGEIRDLAPDGLLVGNGPGDPAAVTPTIDALRELIGELPVFGICLGHQLLALALGAETYKLRFGHHGANLPVLHKPSGRVEITSQNHGFAVEERSLRRVGAVVTRINLNDRSVEGFNHTDKRILAVQFHPEASPGPHDAQGLFGEFVELIGGTRLRGAAPYALAREAPIPTDAGQHRHEAARTP